MFKNKWLLCACVIACILAYYGDEQEDDFARGAAPPASCAASASSTETASPKLSVTEAEQQCSVIRNARRHRQG